MSFITNNQDFFFSNSSMHNINTRNNHHLHRPNANLSCFRKSTFYAGIKIFNSLAPSVTILRNDKAKFTSCNLKKTPKYTLHLLCILFLRVKMIYKTFCTMFVVFYTVNLYTFVFMTCSTPCCLYDTLMDPWNV